MASICNVAVRPQLALSTSAAHLKSKTVAGMRPLPARASKMRVHASDASSDSSPGKRAEKMGFDTSEGLFGFTPFGELWVGRLAMSGFLIGVADELVTGQGILEQVGLMDGSGLPNPSIFSALCLALLVPTAIATVNTLSKVSKGDMSLAQFKGYAKFFGLDTEEDAKIISTMNKLALKDSMKGLTYEDSSLTAEDAARCDLTARAPRSAWPRPSGAERSMMAELDYAKGVEMTNGRWAMLGFALAITIEAGTGAGVVDQIMFYLSPFSPPV